MTSKEDRAGKKNNSGEKKEYSIAGKRIQEQL